MSDCVRAAGRRSPRRRRIIWRSCGGPCRVSTPRPDCATGLLSAKLARNSTLKTYAGFPHGMPTSNAETINADLLAFIRG
ncbi:alpha/beta hydrolase [Burkholderia lata]|uniref:Alpha/beta hydrolase n=1 Tax=Burkholderia lata (strain ATCC 17760 / DSM 23089 / LMG 22485 / NCIMB 9086 / R18194 / 383) TaxID=482957 RepID=A0A6P2T9S9_BURL3|nr:alpha/beta hydrolase [Burkholderia lata]